MEKIEMFYTCPFEGMVVSVFTVKKKPRGNISLFGNT